VYGLEVNFITVSC